MSLRLLVVVGDSVVDRGLIDFACLSVAGRVVDGIDIDRTNIWLDNSH